jgi:SulP family sulfate permease
MGDKPFLRLVAVPAIGWIRAYKPNESPRDLVAGLSLAAFVIPESLAYASLAQLPPVALALIVGVVCIAGRFLGLANMAYFISDAILIGFKTGAAIYIASTQLPKLFGIEGISGNVFERFGHVVLSLHETHVFSLVVGLAAIALFATFGRIFPGRPTTLFVVVVAIAVMSVFGLAETGIKIVGEIPTGLPAISVPNVHLSDISALLPIALACVLPLLLGPNRTLVQSPLTARLRIACATEPGRRYR